MNQSITKEESVPVFGQEDVRVSKVEKYKWSSSGKPSALVWIPKGELDIDPSYQRITSNKTLIKDITRKFNWVAFGALIVSKREERNWVIDGAHRLKGALQRSDIEEVPCLVFDQESLQNEAADFLSINNNRRSVTPVDKFRAEVVSENEEASSLNRFINDQGYKIGNDSNPKSIECVKALQAEWNDNKERFMRLWPVIVEMHKDAPRMMANVIRGLCWLDRKRKINDAMREKLVRFGAEAAATKMRQFAIRAGKSGPPVYGMALKKMCAQKEIK